MYIKQWLESKEVIYYKRYVDDILTIFDQNKTDEKTIMNHMYDTDKHLEFNYRKKKKYHKLPGSFHSQKHQPHWLRNL